MGVVGESGIGMLIVFIFFSESMRPKDPKASTEIAIIRNSPCGNRDTMHTLSTYSITHTVQCTQSSAVSGSTLHLLFLKINEGNKDVRVLAKPL